MSINYQNAVVVNYLTIKSHSPKFYSWQMNTVKNFGLVINKSFILLHYKHGGAEDLTRYEKEV